LRFQGLDSMPHAAQAERLVPAQRMVVVLQHWRAHLAELQPKAQLKSAKDGQVLPDCGETSICSGLLRDMATGVMADIPGDHLPSLSTDDAHAGLPAWHTVKETTLRSWTISRCEVLMVFLGGR